MMAKILQFPQPQGRVLASIDFFLEPDGSVLARLSDMPPSRIEEIDGEPFEKMLTLSKLAMKGAENLAEQAENLRPISG